MFSQLLVVSLFYINFAYSEEYLNNTQNLADNQAKTLPQQHFNRTIQKIEIIGNKVLQKEAIENNITVEVGQTVSPENIKDTLKKLYQSGYLKDVQIQFKDGILKILVEEKLSIEAIDFQGFTVITPSQSKEKLQSKVYAIADDKKIEADRLFFEAQYKEKGYFFVKVWSEWNESKKTLIFHVQENSPLMIQKIYLLGNSYFSDAELKVGMLSKEKKNSSWITSDGIYRKEVLDRDKEYLSFFYKNNGFAESVILDPTTRIIPPSHSQIAYTIEEGPRFFMGTIKVSGDVLFPLEEVLEKLPMKQGKVFRITQFQESMKVLSDLYGDKGYAFVDILPKTASNKRLAIIDVDFVIKKGVKAYFKEVEIEGNSKTWDNVLRRNLRFHDGELYSATALEKTKLAIEKLGFFQEVTIKKEPRSFDKTVAIKIKVKEKSTGSLSASIGATPGSGNTSVSYMLQGNYTEANLLGRGWSAGVNGQMKTSLVQGKQDYDFRISFTEPSLFDGPWSYGISTQFSTEHTYEIPTEPNSPILISGKTGLNLSLGRELIEDLRFTLGYNLNNVHISPAPPPLFAPFTEHGYTESLLQRLTYDKTNNSLMPTDGYFAEIRHTLALPIFVGEHSFGKWESSLSWYVPWSWNDDFPTNFRFSLEPAYIYPLKASDKVPVWQRFWLGSNFHMKAFRMNRLVGETASLPQPIYWNNEQIREYPLYGNKRLYGSAEYFIPLVPEMNLRLVTFGEAGTVLSERDTLSTQPLRYDVGFGLRILTPIAPFRFEWVWAIENNKGKTQLGNLEFVFMVGPDNFSEF